MMKNDDPTDTIARLLRAAGRRAGPPSDSHARVLAASHAVWSAGVRARRRRRWISVVAAAACVAVIGVGIRLSQPEAVPSAPIARLDRAIGMVQARLNRRDHWAPLIDEAWLLSPGSSLRTAAGSRAGLLLADGSSLRVGEATEIEFLSARTVRLTRGRIYIDTGAQADKRSAPFAVATTVGTVFDVGTQFEVQYADAALRVRVREGRIVVRQSAGGAEASAGEELATRDGVQYVRSTLALFGQAWEWTESVAPSVSAERLTIGIVLDWVQRETGRPIRFAPALRARDVTSTELNGNLQHLAPLEALRVSLTAIALDYTVLPDGSILVRVGPAGE